MNRKRSVAMILALSSLLILVNLAGARPLKAGMQRQPQEPTMRYELSVQTGLLSLLPIEVCEACSLSREEISAMKRGCVMAAHAAGYQVDIIAMTPVRIVETGTLENGTPYVRGEAAGIWFRVGNPDSGETLGSVVGRMTFVILSGAR